MTSRVPHVLSDQVQQDSPADKLGLALAIKEEWVHLPTEPLANSIHTPRRLAAVIKAHGLHP